MLDGRKGLRKDLDRLDPWWAEANCMRLNKAKCWLLHLGYHIPMQYDRVWLESCHEEKDQGMLVNSAWTWAISVPGGQKANAILAVSAKLWPEEPEQWFYLLLHIDEATPRILCSVLGPLLQEWHWVESREGQQNWERVWRTNLMRSIWGSWSCLAWIKGWSEETLLALRNYLKGDYNKVHFSLFSHVTRDSTKENGLRLPQERFRLSIRKNFFIKRGLRH